MAEHTPGPWEALPPAKLGKHWRVAQRGMLGGGGVLGSATAMWLIAVIENGAPGDTLETEEANARLIAAAPDLLAACERLLPWATLSDGETVTDDVMNPHLLADVQAARAAIAKARGTT